MSDQVSKTSVYNCTVQYTAQLASITDVPSIGSVFEPCQSCFPGAFVHKPTVYNRDDNFNFYINVIICHLS